MSWRKESRRERSVYNEHGIQGLTWSWRLTGWGWLLLWCYIRWCLIAVAGTCSRSRYCSTAPILATWWEIWCIGIEVSGWCTWASWTWALSCGGLSGCRWWLNRRASAWETLAASAATARTTTAAWNIHSTDWQASSVGGRTSAATASTVAGTSSTVGRCSTQHTAAVAVGGEVPTTVMRAHAAGHAVVWATASKLCHRHLALNWAGASSS